VEEKKDAEVRQMLLRIRQGVSVLGRRPRPLTRWLTDLEASLGETGVREGLAADSAGVQLLELTGRLGRELAEDRLDVGFADWRRWLSRQLESATYRDRSIESPVVFTGLVSTQLRRFDAVLVMGCDAAHLPGPDPVAMFFNQGVRAELGLPAWPERVREMEEQLAALIAGCPTVVITWQRLLAGEENLLSPLVERVAALHLLAYEADLRAEADSAWLAGAEVRAPGESAAIGPTRRPAPAAPPALLPRRISASGYNSLVACPYQFHARYVLRLAELDDVQELIEKKDYGSVVHRVLARFHKAHARVSALEPAAAARELEEMSEREFAGAVARNYLARAWLARWKALIPAYVEWQRGWEAAGWSWKTGEVAKSVAIDTPGGNRVELHGRLDRVDEGAGGVAVLDYKTSDPQKLKRMLDAPGEDVQLPVYALLWGVPVAEALFLSMEREEVKPVAVPGVQPLAAQVRKRLAEVFDALAAGAPMPAQGVEGACEYCEARGLCRRNYWP
jgi:ATP-dependent helicase/nuclease subunit B